MQDSRAASTLELVVNEQQQQLQNMSQIDLSRQSNQSSIHDDTGNSTTRGTFNLGEIKSWPARFRDSLSAKLDEAKAKSETKTQYAIEVVRAFSGIFIWLGCFVCTIIVPAILLFIGLFNLDECTASPSLPYYVFTIGFVMTASNLFNLALALDLPILANHRLLASDIKSIIASILNIVFNSVVAFFYILTAYKILTIGHNTRRTRDDDITIEPGSTVNHAPAEVVDCDDTLYQFTFWFVALTLGLFVTTGLLGLILFLYNRYRLAIIRGSMPRSHPHPGNLTINQTNLSPHVTSTNGI